MRKFIIGCAVCAITALMSPVYADAQEIKTGSGISAALNAAPVAISNGKAMAVDFAGAKSLTTEGYGGSVGVGVNLDYMKVGAAYSVIDPEHKFNNGLGVGETGAEHAVGVKVRFEF